MTARLVVDGRDVAPLEVATTAATRSRGLLGRDGVDGAMWLAPAKQVHSLGMRFDLDIAFVTADGTVLRSQRLARNRMTRVVWRAHAVVEAQAGAFDRWGVRAGAVIAPPSS